MAKRQKRKDNGISYQNKDIVSKVFAETMKEKSLRVYGVHIPKVIRVLPTNLPAIEVNEQRIDNIFLLEDKSYAIIDYESEYSERNKLKYIGYILRALRGLVKDGISLRHIVIRMIVIYTADVTPQKTNAVLNVFGLRLITEEGFLSEIDGDETYRQIEGKIKNKQVLTDEDVMKLIILPLTYKGDEAKRDNVGRVADLVENIDDSNMKDHILAGLISFADKIIGEELEKKIRGQITMTNFGKMLNDEIAAAVEQKEEEVTQRVTQQVTQKVTQQVTQQVTQKVSGKERETAIRMVVDFAKMGNCSLLDVVERIATEYGISKAEAEKKVKAVW